jgi:hypothetical protein
LVSGCALPNRGNDEGRLPLRCREGYFRAMPWRSVSPAYGYSIAGRVPWKVSWTEVEYGNIMQHVKKWMEGIHRWNAVFLLHAGIFFDKSMQTRFGLAAECTLL